MRTFFNFFVFYVIFFVMLAPLRAAPGAASPADFGDYFYRQRRFNLAAGEYEKALLGPERDAPPRAELRAKLALALLRDRQYQASLKHLNEQHPFALLYLRVYASLKVGYLDTVRRDREYARASDSFRPEQKDRLELLAGTIYLEDARYEEAWRHYEHLQKESTDQETRRAAGGVLTALKEFQDQPAKSPWLAGAFSAALPGAGQVYAGHEVDGMIAFFFNLFFIGSALALYDLERAADRPHTASGVFGVVGLFFYVTNIVGAVASAKRYNIHQERVFQQDVRDRFFNTDFVERTSGVQFRVKF